jgi:hypothetical protein
MASSLRDNQKQDHESVRTLAIQIGVRPAARQLGLNEDTVCSWAKRENWFATPGNPQPIQSQALQARPGDVMLNELQKFEGESRLSLAKANARMAKDCEELPARHAKTAHIVAQTMAIVHRQGEHGSGQSFSLNILNLGSCAVQVRDQDTQDNPGVSE